MKRSFILWLLAACGGSSSTPTTTPTTTPTPTETSTTQTRSTVTDPTQSNAPEISRSEGAAGGFIILWPRMKKDASSSGIAKDIQDRLTAIVKRVAPGKAVDVRPEPERACPRQGCKAIAIGAALMRNGDACAVVATISASGPSEQTLVPWVGDMILKSPVAAFREPPEGQLQIKDYAVCSTVAGSLGAKEKDLEAAIKLAAGL